MSQHAPKIVVTGGAGFIGSHLVDRLLADGAPLVVAVDNLSRGRLEHHAHLRAEPRFRMEMLDIRDVAAVQSVVRDADVVYHLAAQSTVMGGVRDIDYTFTSNVVGTFNVLRASAKEGVRRVVFASSREVYGEPIALPVNEDAPLLPINSYGATKLAGEALCRAFRRESGLDTIVLRLANVYGPRDTGRVIPIWTQQALAGQTLHVYGGKQIIDFVWVGQIVEALVRAAAADFPFPPINIGSGTGTRIVEVARRISRLAANQPRVSLEPARPMEVTKFVANVERMWQFLRIEPQLDPLIHLPALFDLPVSVA